MSEAPAPTPARAAPRSRFFGASLFVQLFTLVVISLAAGQAISLAIIYFLPQPPPSFFRVSEIAHALQAPDGVAARNGQKLVAVTKRAPGADQAVRNVPVAAYLQRELTQQLGRPAGDVRLVLLDALQTPVRRSVSSMRRQFGPEPLEKDADHFVVAPFEAALKRPDGRWQVLREFNAAPFGTWRQRVVLWFAVSALALAPLAYLFARRMAAPFTAFAVAAERLGRDPRAPPLHATGSTEILRSVAAFNEMQERLRRYVDDRTAMIGAIAHDLRTPLTRLRFRAESAPAALQPKMVADIEQMEAMIAAVMAFVRDASRQGERQPLELSSLVGTVADEMADTGLDVSMAETGAVVVDGDALQLRRLVSNLFDNAVKFGRSARARVYAADGAAVIEVEDDGPGLPEGQREKVFEPFYRTEPSRSRQTGGAGLGLAVVRTIARAHGGDAEVENRPEGGLLARARFPLAQAPL